jgi:hypothetical protein
MTFKWFVQPKIGLKTVRNHLSNIYNKMQVTDRMQAVLNAREAGLGVDKSDNQSQAREYKVRV